MSEASAKKRLIVIGGATATGKSKLAIRLASHFDTEILSADSRQFYKGLDIGTAKPEPNELALVRHHFVDFLEPDATFSVGDFEMQALEILKNIFQKKDCAILAGGSGFYIKAVCEGLDDFPEVPKKIREELEMQFQNEGLAPLREELKMKDPATFQKIDLNNPARFIRALSVIRASGMPFSAFQGRQKPLRFFQPIYILFELPRTELYARIDSRVDEMIEKGLVGEARKFYSYKNCQALQTVGYQELFDWMDEKMTLPEAIEKIKQHSRNYAKRQATWFKKYGNWTSFHPEDFENILQYIEEKLKT